MASPSVVKSVSRLQPHWTRGAVPEESPARAYSADYLAVVGGTILAAIIITLVNLCVDILYSWVDPRIRMA